MLLLTLSDSTGARAETQFAGNELANEERVWGRLYKVWGDVLEVRSHRQLEALLGSASGE